MEEKNWYIYRENHHLGPYTFQDLENFLDEGTLSTLSLVWKEGGPEWLPISEWSDFDLMPLKESPQLPLLPEEDNFFAVPMEKEVAFADLRCLESPFMKSDFHTPTVEKKEKISSKKTDEIFEEMKKKQSEFYSYGRVDKEDLYFEKLAPAKDKREIFSSQVLPSLQSKKEKLPPIPQIDPVIEKEVLEENTSLHVQRKNPKWMAVSTVAFIILATLYFSSDENRKTQNLIFKGVIPEKSEGLASVLESHLGENPKFALGMKKDQSGIWVSSNLKSKSQVFVTIKSISRKILSHKSISMKAKGIMDKGIVLLDKFEFIEGEKIIPGYYSYKVDVKRIDFISRLVSWWKSGPIHSREFVEGTFLAFGGDKKSFSKEVITYLSSYKENEINYYEIFTEKYKTLSSVLEQIENLYFRSLRGFRTGKDVRNFELSYLSQFSDLLQKMLITNQDLAEKSRKTDLQKSEEYLDIVSLIKKMAGLSAEMVESGEVVKVFTTEEKLRFHSLFAEKIEALQDLLNLKIEEVQNKLSSLKKDNLHNILDIDLEI